MTTYLKSIIFIVLLSLSIGCATKNSKKVIEVDNKNPKVILITIDGLRWQELFTGADSLLVSNQKYVKDTLSLKKEFWKTSTEERKKIIFPFVWSHIEKTGTIYGNRNHNNKVNLVNNHWFSYPGYSEILCGFADDTRINSNDKISNPNVTILEHVNNTKIYKNKVAAFASWDVFPFIINKQRSSLPINAGFDIAKNGNLSTTEKVLNKIQAEIPSPWHNVRLDAFTHNYALEYMKKEQPNLLYISYGETDDFAHDGKYDAYLHAAKRTDTFIKELWEFTQKNPFYKDNTTFIITTDHGRGTVPLETWQHHGNNLNYHNKTYTIKGSNQVWLAAFGAQVKTLGEVKDNEQLYSHSIAATIAKILKVDTLPKNATTNILPFLK